MESYLNTIVHYISLLSKSCEPYAHLACEILLSSLNEWRTGLNRIAARFEAYQLIGITIGLTWLAIRALDSLRAADREGDLWSRFKGAAFRALIKLPLLSSYAATELDKTVSSIRAELMKPYANQEFIKALPRKGRSPPEILSEIAKYQHLSNIKWKDGYVSGGIYASLSDDKLMSLMKDVYGLTAYTNPLHPDIFPGIRKMEAEVVRMVTDMYNGDGNACGTMTSGGTESIVMACKAYRDYARAVHGITEPEMLVPSTAHAAFDKAGSLLKIKVVHIPVDSITWRVSISSMKRAISKKTILLVGSAPNFPHGIIDPIEDISLLGLRYNIPVHVDACLGGFLVPFMGAAGYPLPLCDFRLPGVTSISADTHKYGYAPKGSSVILYRDIKYRHYQFSVQPDWPGGVYASPTISGSRAGGNIATCWASLLYHGYQGYVDATARIMQVVRSLKTEISKMDGVFIYGDPQVSVIALGSNDFNILEMAEQLSKRGWNFNSLQFPSGFHICLTLMHTLPGIAERIVSDMKEIAGTLKASPNAKLTGQAAVYGMAQALPDRTMISDLAKVYLDTYYSTEKI